MSRKRVRILCEISVFLQKGGRGMAQNVTTKLEDLNLTDRFLFDETMENREAYEATVNILLENEIELLERPETEKEFRVSPELRAIRLDVIIRHILMSRF